MRTIQREPGFDDAAAAIIGSVFLADKALEGLEWVLARETDFSGFPNMGRTRLGDLFAFKTPPLGPSSDVCLVIFFTYDSINVRFHHHDGLVKARNR